MDTNYKYIPFYIAMSLVTVYTIIHQLLLRHRSGMIAMNDFMGVWFLLFGIIKLFDLKWFVRSYHKYDIIAKHRIGYAYLFPFLEIALWFAYLFDTQMHYRVAINGITLSLVAITWVVIFRSLKKKETIDCVCMGTLFPLPMSTINLRENVSMGAMAFVMLIRMWSMNIPAISANELPTQQTITSTGASCH